MKTLYYVTARNMKLFFKDKGMFFTSLITPLILLVLFFTFLGNVYRDTFLSFVPDGVQVPAALADGFVGGLAAVLDAGGLLRNRRVLLQYADGAG